MQNPFPLVSVVIPFYNQNESYLRECLLSALLQTYQNIEVLVSDNHSDNGCEIIVYEFSKSHPQLRIIRPETQLSMCAHFNYAINQAKGQYVTMLCSDDVLDFDHVSRLITPLLSSSDISLSCSLPFQAFYPNVARPTSGLMTGIYTSYDFIYLCLTSYVCSLGAALFRRETFLTVGGLNPKLHYAFDVELLFKLILSGNVYLDSRPTAFIRLWRRDEQNARSRQHIIDMINIFDGLVKLRLPIYIQAPLMHRQLNLLTRPLLKLLIKNGPLHIYLTPSLVDKINKITPSSFDRFAFSSRSSIVTVLSSTLCLIFHKLLPLKAHYGKYTIHPLMETATSIPLFN